ncbi:MAG: hypothetical protein LAO05_00475 [Acidobacteriia bacterium]|nr:hypothetical protein [Terriglobia bacterium]
MLKRRRATILAVVLAAAAVSCRHATAPEMPVPQDWRSLMQHPGPFAALYRFSCCGQRNLILAVRSGADRLSISVAVPPGGTAMSAWFAGDEGWVERVKERCREPLPHGMFPLSKDAALPLDPDLAALVLSGLLPEGAHEVPLTPGWVEASNERLTWRARIEGPPTHCSRVLVLRPGEERPLLGADLKSPIGHVPGALVLTAGSKRVEMVLEEWHAAEPPPPPEWLAVPACGAMR